MDKIGLNIIQIGCDDCTDEVFSLVQQNQNNINKLIIVDAMLGSIECAKNVYSFLGNRLIAINCAIGLDNGITKFYSAKDSKRCTVASINKNHVIAHHHPELDEYYLPILNINTFLKSLDLGYIDYFFIDIEGLDVPVLLDMNMSIKPKNIKYEFYHSDGTFKIGNNEKILEQKLINNGYIFTKRDEYNLYAKLK